MRITEAQLVGVIDELHAAEPDRRIRGVFVRRVLAERFGSRAGTDRIYRALHSRRERMRSGDVVGPAPSSDAISASEREDYERRINQLTRDLERESSQVKYYAVELDKARQSQNGLLSAQAHAKLLDSNLQLHRAVRDREDAIAVQRHHIQTLEETMRSEGLPIPSYIAIERPR